MILAERVKRVGVLYIAGPVSIHAVLTFPNVRSDLDGPSKALLDALVSGGVIDDDRYIQELRLYRCQGEAGVVVTIESTF